MRLKIRTLTIVGAILAVYRMANAQESTTQGDVALRELVVTKAHGAKYYTATIDYDFGSRSGVTITALGDIKGKGQLKYTWQNQEVVFRDPATKAVLNTVSLDRMVALQEDANPNLPDDTTYSPAGTDIPWPHISNVPDRIRTVLAHDFPRGYVMRERDSTITYTTVYHGLGLGELPRNLLGQVAVALSFPKVAGSADHITVRFTCRERRKKSAEGQWFPPSEPVAVAADKVVKDLISHIASI